MSEFTDEDGNYDEETFTPPDPTEKPVIDIKVSNYDLGRMLDYTVNSAIERHTKKAVEKWVEKKVAKAVDALVKEVTADMIRAHVEKALTEGWGKVNEWGEQRGEKVTLASVSRDALMKISEAPRADYNGNRQPSPMEAIIIAMAQDGLKTGLKPLLDEAKKKLQTSLDVQFGQALRLTLSDALKGG